MKTPLFILAGILLVAAPVTMLHSQAAQPKTPLETLQILHQQNTLLIEKQAATLLKLDELAKDAQQLKFFSKRA